MIIQFSTLDPIFRTLTVKHQGDGIFQYIFIKQDLDIHETNAKLSH